MGEGSKMASLTKLSNKITFVSRLFSTTSKRASFPPLTGHGVEGGSQRWKTVFIVVGIPAIILGHVKPSIRTSTLRLKPILIKDRTLLNMTTCTSEPRNFRGEMETTHFFTTVI